MRIEALTEFIKSKGYENLNMTKHKLYINRFKGSSLVHWTWLLLNQPVK